MTTRRNLLKAAGMVIGASAIPGKAAGFEGVNNGSGQTTDRPEPVNVEPFDFGQEEPLEYFTEAWDGVDYSNTRYENTEGLDVPGVTYRGKWAVITVSYPDTVENRFDNAWELILDIADTFARYVAGGWSPDMLLINIEAEYGHASTTRVPLGVTEAFVYGALDESAYHRIVQELTQIH